LNSKEIIAGSLCLFLVFLLLRPQIFNLLNHLARINVRGAKNLEYIDKYVEPETQTPSSPVLPTGIEFEGFYDKESLRKKETLIKYPSRDTLVRRVVMALILTLILIPLIIYIYQTKQYFSRLALFVPLLLYLIYSMTLHPYVTPYLATLFASKKSKEEFFRKGIISSEGITYISPGNLESIPWNKIYRVKRTDDLIILFADYSPSMAFARNFFKSEVDWQQFGRWVDFYIKHRS
jgi:hypothetical protein